MNNVPIRLTQTPSLWRVSPFAGIECGVGGGHHLSSRTAKRAECTEDVEAAAEPEPVEAGLQMLGAHAVGMPFGDDDRDRSAR